MPVVKRLERPFARCPDFFREEGTGFVLPIEHGQILGVIDAERSGTLTAHRLLEWLAAPGSRMLVGGRRIEPGAPDVLVCDDPIKGRDCTAAEDALHALQHANRQGQTIVIVTDALEVIRRICRAVAVVERGEMVEQFYLEDLLAVPRTEAGRGVLRGGRPRWGGMPVLVHPRAPCALSLIRE